MIFYFLITAFGLIVAARLIFNELRKEKQRSVVSSDQNENASPVSSILVQSHLYRTDDFIQEDVPLSFDFNHPPEDLSLTKMESLLKEKNIEIDHVKALLEVEKKNRTEYEKIKNLLQSQIFESRQMNREVQRQLKYLQAQADMLDSQTHKLKAELVYKDQLLLKKDYQLTELNTALQAHLLPKLSDHLSKNTDNENLSDSASGLEWRNKN